MAALEPRHEEIYSGPAGIWGVEDWRLQKLIEADYPVELATALAVRVDVDLHQALELVAHGCPHETAGRILL